MFSTRQEQKIIQRISFEKIQEQRRIRNLERLKPGIDRWPETKEKFFPSGPVIKLIWDHRND